MNTEIDKLKEDIIERYNLTWECSDTTGMIQECKDNFKNLIDLLIKKVEENTLKFDSNIQIVKR